MKTLKYLSILLIFTACGPDQAPVENEAKSEAISLTEDQLAYNEIETGNLERGPLFHKIKATGKLDVPPNLSVKLTAPISSYVAELRVLPGDKVAKGSVIAVLRDPSISKVQEDYISTKADFEFLSGDLNRKSQLLESSAVSQREFENLKSRVAATEAHLEGLKEELARLGIDPAGVESGSISQFLRIKAPISGTLTELFQKVGTFVSNDAPLVSLLSREHEHVELEIFQQDLVKVKKNMQVRLRLPGEDAAFDGHVFLVNTQLNPTSLSSNVHVHPEEDFPVIPVGSVVFAEVIYQVDTAYLIPKRELIHEGQANFIFLKTDAGFEKQEVKIGYDDGDHIEITGPPSIFNQQVVTRGNYYLNGI